MLSALTLIIITEELTLREKLEVFSELVLYKKHKLLWYFHELFTSFALVFCGWLTILDTNKYMGLTWLQIYYLIKTLYISTYAQPSHVLVAASYLQNNSEVKQPIGHYLFLSNYSFYINEFNT